MPSLKNLYLYLHEKPIIGAITVASFYFFGTFGILIGYGDWFIPKTAFNLILSFIFLLIYQQQPSYKLILALLICYFVGFTAEFLGVQYGLIFGDYFYPPTLGPQLFGVPLVIGVNWYLLTFVVWNLLARLSIKSWLKIVIASLLTTLIDFIIEPVAIKLNFWQWDGAEIPLQNYVGWFFISLIIFTAFHLIKVPTKNALSKHLLFWQLSFFIILSIFL